MHVQTRPPGKMRIRGHHWCGLVLLLASLSASGLAADSTGLGLVPVTGQPLRVWQDDSGYHRVRARLVGVGSQTVRLLKDNQKVTTVPLQRLSRTDRDHVASLQIVYKPTLPSLAESAGPLEPESTPQASVPKHRVASIQLTREFLNRFVQKVERRQAVATTILGVPIRGWAQTTASASVKLIPNATRAVLEIPIRGQVTSQTVGTASVAQVHSESATDFEKSLKVSLSVEGISVEPLPLSTTNRFINSSVSTTARALPGLVTRIAQRRVQANKPVADQIAQQQERDRINRVFEVSAKENVGRLNQMLRDFVEGTGESPLGEDARLRFSTTDFNLTLAVTTDSLPENFSPPPAIAAEAPLVAQLHASFFLQAAQGGMAADMTARLQEMAAGESAVLEKLRSRLQEGKFVTAWSDDESWLTITWRPHQSASERPADEVAQLP